MNGSRKNWLAETVWTFDSKVEVLKRGTCTHLHTLIPGLRTILRHVYWSTRGWMFLQLKYIYIFLYTCLRERNMSKSIQVVIDEYVLVTRGVTWKHSYFWLVQQFTEIFYVHYMQMSNTWQPTSDFSDLRHFFWFEALWGTPCCWAVDWALKNFSLRFKEKRTGRPPFPKFVLFLQRHGIGYGRECNNNCQVSHVLNPEQGANDLVACTLNTIWWPNHATVDRWISNEFTQCLLAI